MKQYSTYLDRVRRLSNQINGMYERNIPMEKIRFFYEQQKANVKPDEILDFIISMRYVISHNPIEIPSDDIMNFILSRISDISIEDVQRVLEESDKEWKCAVRGGYTISDKALMGIDRVRSALPILLLLQGQKIVSDYISKKINEGKIGPHVAYFIFDCYINSFHLDGGRPRIMMPSRYIRYMDCDFLYKLLRYIFEVMPESKLKEMRETRDIMLVSFMEVYGGVPYGYSNEQFKLFLNCIRHVDNATWLSKINISCNEVLDFVENQYRFKFKNCDFSLVEYDDLSKIEQEKQKLAVIVRVSRYMRQLADEIDDFLQKHPIGLYWQVRMMKENPDYTQEDCHRFIQQHLHEFSYEEMLSKILNTYISEHIEVAIYIAIKLKGVDILLKDIFDAFNEGKIKLPELEYLHYAYPDKQLIDGLKQLIDKANLETKK